MRKAHLRLVAPKPVNGTVRTYKRKTNAEVRSREYLTHDEVEVLIKLAGTTRNGHRDACLVLVMSRHGLRVKELVDLRWDQVDFAKAVIHINRVKRGSPATHPIPGRELRWLRRLHREQLPPSAFVFTSERHSPFSCRAIHKLFAGLGVKAGIPFPVHPHMARHFVGYSFVNKGVGLRVIQSYLGHKSITHTVRYTALSSRSYSNLWDD